MIFSRKNKGKSKREIKYLMYKYNQPEFYRIKYEKRTKNLKSKLYQSLNQSNLDNFLNIVWEVTH